MVARGDERPRRVVTSPLLDCGLFLGDRGVVLGEILCSPDHSRALLTNARVRTSPLLDRPNIGGHSSISISTVDDPRGRVTTPLKSIPVPGPDCIAQGPIAFVAWVDDDILRMNVGLRNSNFIAHVVSIIVRTRNGISRPKHASDIGLSWRQR